ncbi:MAG TPA: hypothetical protein VF796_01690 [Humisphaera sp.]
MAYDKAKFHYDGKFPADLPPENGATHIGMFLAWAAQRGLTEDAFLDEEGIDVGAVRARRMTGRDLLVTALDGVLSEDDLNDEGNAFAESYYLPGTYGEDYDNLFKGSHPTRCHVEDDWANFDRVARMIDARYAAWKSAGGSGD